MGVTAPISTTATLAAAPCPLCQALAARSFEKFGSSYYLCSCGFTFIWPRPSADALTQLYHSDGESYWADERMQRVAFSPGKSRREIEFLKRCCKAGTLLDIGCSTGSFVEAAEQNGFDAQGVDIAGPSIEVGKRRGLRLEAGDVLTMPMQADFDVVTMWATLEHLPDPMRHLRRAHELLRNGGWLFVSVPNHRGISQRLLGMRNRYLGSEHLNYFTPAVLERTLQHCGFVPQRKTTYSFNPLIFAKDLLQGGSKQVGCESMAADSAFTLRAKQSWIGLLQYDTERLLNLFSAGDVVAIAARKMQ
jgi:2-polyprenyl-3-methyl-5-hydroxy-6-metoxy-1,4-benzoquinol methylase